VQYVSVIGTGVKGSLLGKGDEEKAKKKDLAETIQSLVAYSSYLVLSGEGEGVLGDGECSAALSSQSTLLCKRHSTAD
jgi:hypothetical protein